MKILKQIILMALLVVGLSMTAMAQKDDNKNRPPKDPPTIPAPDKNPPKDKPKDKDNDNRPKKPQSAIFVSGNQAETRAVR
jgi:hypothetical protein